MQLTTTLRPGLAMVRASAGFGTVEKKMYVTNFFSMLQEWGATCPPFVAGYRLEHDHSWTPVGNVEEKNTANEMIDKILRANAAGSKLQLTFGN